MEGFLMAGGYRAGGGRVPKIKPGSVRVDLQGPFEDARSFLLALINNSAVPLDLRARCAISLLPYEQPRADGVGKRRAQVERAEKLAATAGAFAVPALPKRPN
jgi:hypothetical protein